MATEQRSDRRVGVTGIGGVFLKANDPAGLADWYSKNFGLTFQSGDCGTDGGNYWLEFVYCDHPDRRQRAATVFAIQRASAPLPAERREAEINYQVADLDRLLTQLAAAGIPIEKREDYDYGRFAWLRDPEGNRMELFEPR